MYVSTTHLAVGVSSAQLVGVSTTHFTLCVSTTHFIVCVSTTQLAMCVSTVQLAVGAICVSTAHLAVGAVCDYRSPCCVCEYAYFAAGAV